MPLYSLEDKAPKLPNPDRCWIAPSAEIIGDVTIEEDVSFWFQSVARGDNEPMRVGAGSNIQEHVVLHSDPGFPLKIGRNVTVGHRAMLHGCEIGDGCLIGMGAIILNGAKIGENALIGAGALVGEGKEIPPRSLVLGLPAKVIRTLEDTEIDNLQRSAKNYRANYKRFKAELRET